jgi:putative ABC transport system substrate-binding protein
MLVVLCTSVSAQQPVRIPRIGFHLDSPFASIAARIEGFRQGLRELGYVEGKNILIEWRSSEGQAERRSEIIAELVRLKVDVIVSGGPSITRPLKDATSSIPIVMAQDSDPVGNGFVASLARPGGNVTGLSNLTPDLIGKRMQLLKEAVPGATRVVVLTHPGSATAKTDKDYATRAQAAGRSLGFMVRLIDAGRPVDLDHAFTEMSRWRANALVVMPYATLLQERTRIMALAAKQRLPAVYAYRENVMEGGLMSYGPDLSDQFRRSAAYVDRILKGAKPGDLPIEQPTKFELLINLKTAKVLGLTIPQSMLLRADEIIQ